MKFTDYLEYKAILGFKNCRVTLFKIAYSDQYHFVKLDNKDESDCVSFEHDSSDHPQSFTSASSSSSRRSSTSYQNSVNVLNREQICKECRVDVKRLAPSVVQRLRCSSSGSGNASRSRLSTRTTTRKRTRLEILRESGFREEKDDEPDDGRTISKRKRAKFCDQTILSKYGVRNCYVKVWKLRTEDNELQAQEQEKETSYGNKSNFESFPICIDSDSDDKFITVSSPDRSSSNSSLVSCKDVEEDEDDNIVDEQLATESEQSLGKSSCSEGKELKIEGDDGHCKDFKLVFSTFAIDSDSQVTDDVKPEHYEDLKSCAKDSKPKKSCGGLKFTPFPANDHQELFPNQRKLQSYKIKKYVGKTAEELRKSRSIPESVHMNMEEKMK